MCMACIIPLTSAAGLCAFGHLQHACVQMSWLIRMGYTWHYNAIKHTHATWHTHVIHMSYTCHHMSYTCHTHVIHMSYTCHKHVIHMSVTCHSHVIHVYYTCHTHAIPMSYTCHTHVIFMSYTCHTRVIYMSATCHTSVAYTEYTLYIQAHRQCTTDTQGIDITSEWINVHMPYMLHTSDT